MGPSAARATLGKKLLAPSRLTEMINRNSRRSNSLGGTTCADTHSLAAAALSVLSKAAAPSVLACAHEVA